MEIWRTLDLTDLASFKWMGDRENDAYSSVYNKLLTNGRSSMTEEECREFAAMVGAFDIDEQIKEIKENREAFLKVLKDDGLTEERLGSSFEDFIRDAFPFEELFVRRY